ncbi:protein SOB FIVE-LIKE 3-like [Coffea arabica]|uniref:Protein SOB FIVE-LIKE 3-like n=1 Tax=Coffea arabica TaxID=13443 RepID=A0ABM4W864_COFAR|nr:uncharacterized protein LOC113717301 [Coffea arabica]
MHGRVHLSGGATVMDDPSENIGGREECNSSESGWTMYIASPVHENNPENDDDDDDDDNYTERKGYKDYPSDDGGDPASDDSMASDASSGPSHQGGPCRTKEGSHRRDDIAHAEGKVNRRSSGKKHDKQVERKQYPADIKAAKKEQGHKAKNATENLQGKGKSRKN